jgi:diguanylate cyclase (GGDEF)-like protein
LSLIRVDYPLGAAGIMIAVIGYGMRSTVTQVRHIEHDDAMQRTHSELQAIAWTDALTGVANRRFFDSALIDAWRNGLHDNQPLSVLMIDIDHFKQLNDHYGHPVGDARLREVAAALNRALTRAGDVLARYGGEEFVALIPGCGLADVLLIAERLRHAVQALAIQNIGSPVGQLTVSIGASSLLPARESDALSIVEAADRALYQAKCAGRNQVMACEVSTRHRSEAADGEVTSPVPGAVEERRGPKRATNVVRPDFRGQRELRGVEDQARL